MSLRHISNVENTVCLLDSFVHNNTRNQSSVSSVPPELADGPPAAVIPLADVGEEVEIPEEDEEYHHVHNHQLR